jgi:hypothetical protein
MAPLVPLFARTTCSPPCALRVERRRLPSPPPLPSKVCAKCQRRFIPGRRGTGKIEVKICSTKCRTRAKDDRKLAQARATRDLQRHCATDLRMGSEPCTGRIRWRARRRSVTAQCFVA